MPSNLRNILGATATVLILAGCATTGGNAPAATAQNSVCPPGSRIPSTVANCNTLGHSYSGDQLVSTGATTAGGALQLLDPSVTVHH